MKNLISLLAIALLLSGCHRHHSSDSGTGLIGSASEAMGFCWEGSVDVAGFSPTTQRLQISIVDNNPTISGRINFASTDPTQNGNDLPNPHANTLSFTGTRNNTQALIHYAGTGTNASGAVSFSYDLTGDVANIDSGTESMTITGSGTTGGVSHTITGEIFTNHC